MDASAYDKKLPNLKMTVCATSKVSNGKNYCDPGDLNKRPMGLDALLI